jgi:tetratricopeptide (TPR) repeat protein
MQLKLDLALDKARKSILLGKLDDAEALLNAVLKARPSHKVALKQLDILRSKRVLPAEARATLLGMLNGGDLEGAIAFAADLQKRYPGTVILYTIQGAAYAQTGETKLAEGAFRKSVSIDPKFSQGFNNLGNSLKEQGQLEEARKSYLKAVSLNPNLAQGFGNLGVVLKEMKKYPQAIRRFEQAIALDPNYHEAYRNLGVLHQECDDHKQAISAFEICLKIAPKDIDAMSYMAGSMRALDDFKSAINAFKDVLKRAPNRWKDRQSLGLSLVEVGKYTEAVAELKEVVAQRPTDVVSLIHYSFALGKMDNLEQAEAALLRVLEIEPENLGALNNLGVMYKNQRDFERAAQIFDKALLIDPTSSEIRMNRSVLHFLGCEFKQAWPLYHSRFEHENKTTAFLETSKPVWTGSKDRVFIWAEQGIGDEVFFASLLYEARNLADGLIVSVDKRLLDMFTRSFDGIRFIARNVLLSETEYDAHIPLGGLGGLLRPDLPSFSQQPFKFLKPDAAKIETYKRWLEPFSGRTIGIAWQTQNRRNNHVRNVDLQLLVNAFKNENVRLINLQYGDTTAETDQVNQKQGVQVLTHPTLDRFNDIEGLSALMAACDSIVTIDNSTVHLAAAMGLDTHLILPLFPDWRWSYVDEGSPWYPHLNIYRQDTRYDWEAVLKQFVSKLAVVAE